MGEAEDDESIGEEDAEGDEDMDLSGEGLDDMLDSEIEEMDGEQDGTALALDGEEDQEDYGKVLQEMRENLPHLKEPAPMKASERLAAVLTRGKSVSVGPDPALRSSPGLKAPTGTIQRNAMLNEMLEKRDKLHEERSKTLSPWSSIPTSAQETRRSFFSSSEDGTPLPSIGARSREGRSAGKVRGAYKDTRLANDRGRRREDSGLAASGSSITMNTRDPKPRASLVGIDELRTLHLVPASLSKSFMAGVPRTQKVAKKMPSRTSAPFGEYLSEQPEVEQETGTSGEEIMSRLEKREAVSDQNFLDQVDDLISHHDHGRKSVWELDPDAVAPEVAGAQGAPPPQTKSPQLATASPGLDERVDHKSEGPESASKSTDAPKQPEQKSGEDEEFVRQAKQVLQKLQGSLSVLQRPRGDKLESPSPMLKSHGVPLKARFAPAKPYQDPAKEGNFEFNTKTFSKARDSRLLLRAKLAKKLAKKTTSPQSCHFVCEGKMMLAKTSPSKTRFKWVKRPREKRRSQMLRHIRSRYATPDSAKAAPGITLDSYLLCHVGGVELPKNLRYIKLHAMKINKVVTNDLLQFTSLRFIDLTDNLVPMDAVASAISMRKLCLQCNQISSLNIPPGTFFSLEILDLSFNNLGSSAMVELAGLPSLRRLNVDHNDIKELPSAIGELGAFPCLQRLSLSGNKLGSSCLIILSQMSRLEKLILSHNRIIRVPPEVDKHSFIQLVFLNLSYNLIVRSAELGPLSNLRSLTKVLLYGNPLSKRAAKDGEGKVLDIGKPIFEDVQRAQLSGQQWILRKPPPRKKPQPHAEKHCIHPTISDTLEHPKIIPVEKLVNAIHRMSYKLEDQLSCGVTSRSMPFEEGMDEEISELAFARTEKTTPAKRVLEVVEEAPLKMTDEEAIKELASEPPCFTLKEHIFDSNAAVTTLKQTLSMPLIEKVFHAAPYQKMTASGVIRARETRLKHRACIRAPELTSVLIEELALKALEPQKNAMDLALKDMSRRLEALEKSVSSITKDSLVAV